MITLAETFSRKGKTLETVATYVQQYVNEHWQDVWHHHLPEIEHLYQRAGDPAYGLYSRTLFGPLQQELQQAGLTCEPALPGTFPLSREAWGPQQARERRFWCVLRQENGEALGALVTRYFHDHTQLRLPQAPQVLALPETDAMAIAVKIEQSALPGL
jgi:hypothetical protein